MAKPANWAIHATLLWKHRKLHSRVMLIALPLSLGIAFVIPKRYESVGRIMPPEQQSGGALMLAALASHAGGLGSLGSLAGGLLSGHTSTALFVDLLHSGTIAGHLIDRFHLQQVYHTRYRIDTAKHLARCTTIVEDKKSGVITVQVWDTDPARARDLAQGYLDELNKLVTQTSTSSAHQERIFIERRLHSVESDLEIAQLKLSEFSSNNSTIDIKEQIRAMVDAAARVQAELLVEQSGLESMRQIYGDSNLRVRSTEARIASLQRELNKMSGSSSPLTSEVSTGAASETETGKNDLYPPLRQLPRLAVPYADLYRQVRVQETVFELLTQQYEMARIEEARNVPVVSVIDPPGIPEKKSFPPRLLLALLLTAFVSAATAAFILMRDRWTSVSSDDLRKILAQDILENVRHGWASRFSRERSLQ
jgi:capsule polysaccharide export protein KpsE/RkpR